MKPGHWATASQEMRANYRDFVGDSRVSVVNSQNRPYPVANTPFDVRASRPVLLTKGRPKTTESTFFVPQTGQPITARDRTRRTRPGPRAAATVIRRSPRCRRISTTSWCWPRSRRDTRSSKRSTRCTCRSTANRMPTTREDSLIYRVVQLGCRPSRSRSPTTRSRGLSIAYMLWDEVDPGDPITPEQERALVDWIHWGGQLIISGPDSLDLLKGSFLEAYLPATSGGPAKDRGRRPGDRRAQSRTG